MKNKYIIVTTIFILLSSIYTTAQEEDFKNVFAFSPQYLANNSLHLEWDFKLDSLDNWLVIAPQFIRSYDSQYDGTFHQDHNSVIGFGLNVMMKSFIYNSYSGEGFYYSYGISYKYHDINVSGNIWESYKEDDITFYKQDNRDYNLSIHNLAGRCTAGFQFSIIDNLIGDAFLGVGIKYPFYNRPEGSYVKFNKGPSDYGYMGTHFIIGFRIGVGW